MKKYIIGVVALLIIIAGGVGVALKGDAKQDTKTDMRVQLENCKSLDEAVEIVKGISLYSTREQVIDMLGDDYEIEGSMILSYTYQIGEDFLVGVLWNDRFRAGWAVVEYKDKREYMELPYLEKIVYNGENIDEVIENIYNPHGSKCDYFYLEHNDYYVLLRRYDSKYEYSNIDILHYNENQEFVSLYYRDPKDLDMHGTLYEIYKESVFKIEIIHFKGKYGVYVCFVQGGIEDIKITDSYGKASSMVEKSQLHWFKTMQTIDAEYEIYTFINGNKVIIATGAELLQELAKP